MNNETLEQIYNQMCARRDAIILHYLNNRALKANDPTGYGKYQKELRDINKRLRIIRQCIPANPVFVG